MNKIVTPLNTSNLKRKQVLPLLNLSTWEFAQMEKGDGFPRIVYNPRVIRYDLADILHYRESKKCGGWIEKAA